MRKDLKNIKLAIVVLLVLNTAIFASVVYVNPGESIQTAIDTASSGDTINVAAGTYIENISLKDGISIIGSDAEVCTIDGSGSNHVVTCSSCSGVTLQGLTLINGNAYRGGGLFNDNSSVSVADCTFTSNTATYGGAMMNRNSSVIITGCKFISNHSQWSGGGIRNEDASIVQITDCIFTDNTVDNDTAGAVHCDSGTDITITDCYFCNNLSTQIMGDYIDGGDNILSETCPDTDGDGIYDVLDEWPNDPNNDIDEDGISGDVDNCPDTYNPVQEDADGDGIGDLCDDWPNDPDNDIDGDGISGEIDNCPETYNPGQEDTNGDGIGDVCQEIIVDPNGSGNFTSIQEAINYSRDGQIVTVMPGRYVENINMLGKSITLQSSDPTNPQVVESTIIDGNNINTVVRCDSDEGPDTVITGFMITNGLGKAGGMYNWFSSPTIYNCIFRSNRGTLVGGMYNACSSSIISNCAFIENTGSSNTSGGGGIFNNSSTVTVSNCTFTSNTTNFVGGGMHANGGTVNNCTFISNTANYYGGGMSADGGTVNNCTFFSNSAFNGGGMEASRATINNCTFSSNSSDGMFAREAAINNCTFISNNGYGICFYNPPNSSLTSLTNNSFCLNTTKAISGDYIDNGGNNFEYCQPQTPIEPGVFGDSDGDGDVDMIDFAAFAENWLTGVE